VDRLVEALQLPAGSSVLDIATGMGETLCRVAERYSARCTGIDYSPYFCEQATHRAQERGLSDLVSFVQMDGASFSAPEATYDAAMCIGAEWVMGGFEATLRSLMRWTKPGGVIVASTPFWLAEPPEAYLQASGIDRSTYGGQAGNVRTARDLGLRLVYHVVSSRDDWDEYQSASWLAAYDYVRDYPDDPDAAEIIERTEQDQAAYFTPGSECLSWATYVFRKP
jgi:ubiquinone/menaquinone biosynthesis C-methylase UbiE